MRRPATTSYILGKHNCLVPKLSEMCVLARKTAQYEIIWSVWSARYSWNIVHNVEFPCLQFWLRIPCISCFVSISLTNFKCWNYQNPLLNIKRINFMFRSCGKLLRMAIYLSVYWAGVGGGGGLPRMCRTCSFLSCQLPRKTAVSISVPCSSHKRWGIYITGHFFQTLY